MNGIVKSPNRRTLQLCFNAMQMSESTLIQVSTIYVRQTKNIRRHLLFRVTFRQRNILNIFYLIWQILVCFKDDKLGFKSNQSYQS